MTDTLQAIAIAHSNIALIKYWGKLARPGNYPAVPSLSLTLDAFSTRTEVCFDKRLKCDEFRLDGEPTIGRALERVSQLLETVRANAGLDVFARVTSSNNYPTASGLASSASGFAALSVAATHAASLTWSQGEQSALARSCSASAARSVFGGWTTLDVGAEGASTLRGVEDWPIALVVAITDSSPKAIGSTEAMIRCSKTSPCYSAWLESAPLLFAKACEAVRQRDIETLGECMEASTWFMHSTMLTANPAVLYLAPTTIAIVHALQRKRSSKVPAFFTTDAGAHVKVLTLAEHAETVKAWLLGIAGVSRVEICRPGPSAHVVEPNGQKS